MLDTEFLRRVDFFHDLSEADLAELRSMAIEQILQAGQVLFLESEPCRGLYLVHSGRVRIYKSSPEGREQVLMVAGVGDSFAEVPAFDGGLNPASAAAMGPATVYLFPVAELTTLVRASPAVALAVIRVFARRLRHLTHLVEDLSFRHVTARVAKLLVQVARGEGPAASGRLTQQEMAAMLGTAREVVARSLRTLEQQQVIRVERGRVIVLRPELLEQMM